MKLPDSPFTAADWSAIEPTIHPGDTGTATWRTMNVGDMRIRRVDYSPGYFADHWCNRGHVLFVLEGELISELKDGRKTTLTAGMSYHVSDFGDPAHRSSTSVGAKLFIVD
ncbi:MAG: DHCW motif cupin fold protein [Caulobacter sp.]